MSKGKILFIDTWNAMSRVNTIGRGRRNHFRKRWMEMTVRWKKVSARYWRLNPLRQRWRRGFLVEGTQGKYRYQKKTQKTQKFTSRKGKKRELLEWQGVPVQDSSGKATWKWTVEGFGCQTEELQFLSRQASWWQQHFGNINLAMVCRIKWSREDWRLEDHRKPMPSSGVKWW